MGTGMVVQYGMRMDTENVETCPSVHNTIALDLMF